MIDTTAEELANLIETNYEEKGILWFKLNREDSIDAETWRELNKLTTDANSARPLRGYKYTYTSKRLYPEGRLASHLIGLTNTNKNNVFGMGGIEGAMDGDLNPRKGYVRKESDAIGQAVANSLVLTVEPKPGSSIYMTLDKKLQMIIETEVKRSVQEFEAKSGSIIIMDPKTGKIMAMASYPDYNPNLREEKNPGVYTNRAISIPYEVGSIGKIFTISATLDNGLIEPDTIIQEDGHEGCEKISPDLLPLCTWNKKPMPPMPAWECVVKSDNLCLYHIALSFGYSIGNKGYARIDTDDYNDFYNYLRDFGIGQATGIDLSGEDQGNLKTTDHWTLGDVAAFSYGHGYTVTALQAISAVSAVANNGIRMRPLIIEKIIKGDGEVIEYKPEAYNEGKPIISKETAETVTKILHKVYLSNFRDREYWYADLKNYNIAMKSGTALIANQYGYTNEIFATQVGYDASPERKFIMLVNLEEPQVGDLSFYNSRVMWFDAFKAIKGHLNIPRKN